LRREIREIARELEESKKMLLEEEEILWIRK